MRKIILQLLFIFLFFFNDTATTEIYTLSLHDALPISQRRLGGADVHAAIDLHRVDAERSEEHTSELQSRLHLVCRLLLEKKQKKNNPCTLKKQKKNTQNKLK